MEIDIQPGAKVSAGGGVYSNGKGKKYDSGMKGKEKESSDEESEDQGLCFNDIISPLGGAFELWHLSTFRNKEHMENALE